MRTISSIHTRLLPSPYAKTLRERGALPANLIILSTASPYKFAASMLKALGAGIPEDGFDAMDSLKAITGRPMSL